MKNRDILLDIIGETDENLIPEISNDKNKSIKIRRSVLSGALVAVLIVCVIFAPQIRAQRGADSPYFDTTNISGNKVFAPSQIIAEAAYPEMPPYPDESLLETDPDAYNKALDEWGNWKYSRRDSYDAFGLDTDIYNGFFESTLNAFLNNSNGENAIYSPLSLYFALGICAEISDGNTRKQLLSLLQQNNTDSLRDYSNRLWNINYSDDGVAKCVLANSLWTNSNIECNRSTLDLLAQNYYASSYSGDPANDEYNQMFRKWLNSQTDDMLNDFTSNMKFSPEMLLTLVSTVSYSGKWNYTFDVKDTKPDVFYTENGKSKCDFMNAEFCVPYSRGERFTAVSLPVAENGEMRIILPDEGINVDELLSDEEAIGYMSCRHPSLYKNYQDVTVILSVPKFDVSSHIDLKDGLMQLGVTDIFSETSDLSPLGLGKDGASLSQAIQDTRVIADEEGCRASTITEMGLFTGAPPEERQPFTVNRPFIFEIVSVYGNPLFVGIVNNPSVQ